MYYQKLLRVDCRFCFLVHDIFPNDFRLMLRDVLVHSNSTIFLLLRCPDSLCIARMNLSRIVPVTNVLDCELRFWRWWECYLRAGYWVMIRQFFHFIVNGVQGSCTPLISFSVSWNQSNTTFSDNIRYQTLLKSTGKCFSLVRYGQRWAYYYLLSMSYKQKSNLKNVVIIVRRTLDHCIVTIIP